MEGATARTNGKHGKPPGFTFIEIMIAVIVILIMMGLVGFTATRLIAQAREAAARTQISLFVTALSQYYFDTGTYPTEEQGLDALWEKPHIPPVPDNWKGPYLTKPVPKDPWGNEYEYIVPGPHGLPYGIRSLGADGMVGGTGEGKDITSWEN